MRDARLFAITLAGTLALLGAARSAAPPPRALHGKPADVFGLTKVWRMHLIVQGADWQTMHPRRGKGKAAGEDKAGAGERKARGGFGFDFAYVRADLEVNGVRLNQIGLRFKGNASYSQAQNGLKKPFRIDFDRYAPGQNFLGLRKVSLNNHVMDPTAARESLSFALYRAAGVPAPRTAYAELSLTVPGKYDRELLGLYTLIESVDRTFLQDRFGSSKGMLLKPERTGPLDYMGESWKPYETGYRPKTRTRDRAQRRLIDLTWLIQQSNDQLFRREIGRTIDVDLFLRYLAATVVLSSTDSFMGLWHNYYLYLDPKRDRFVFMPWDLDHSFGGLSIIGTTASMVDLSVRKPYLGRNRLIERLLADEKRFAAYRGYLERLVDGPFSEEGVRRDLAAIQKATALVKEKERQAAGKRRESGPGLLVGLLFTPSSDLASFARRRTASIRSQLAGKTRGKELSWPLGGLPGPPAWLTLAKLALERADRNKDLGLSKEEVMAGMQALWRACDRDGKKRLDQKALTSAFNRLLPREVPWGTGAKLAQVLVERAAQEGLVSEETLLAATERLFAQLDRDHDARLDERELADGLRGLLPAGNARPAPKKKDPTKERK